MLSVWLQCYNFFVVANYDWSLPESKGHASGYITDLVAFLQSTFMSFTNLPVSDMSLFGFNYHYHF